MSGIFDFLRGSIRQVLAGGKAYKAWVAFLLAIIAVGLFAYSRQASQGLIATNMRDEVSWAFYIGNFTFLVGVAAAAVLLVIPAYVYHWKPLKEVVVLGELLAISALVMCLLFILVDMGRPDRFLHIMPFFGTPNWPHSLLTWDALVLNLYLALNVVVVTHVLHRSFHGREPDRRLVVPLVSDPTGNGLLFIPLVLGLLLLLKLRTAWSPFGNLPIGFLFGVGSALAIGGALSGTLLPQIIATMPSFRYSSASGIT